ncbi:CRPV-348 [Crowpox virus]|nr:CRPV-348 [Crowpox virus]
MDFKYTTAIKICNKDKLINYLSYFICITSVFVILTTVMSIIS